MLTFFLVWSVLAMWMSSI